MIPTLLVFTRSNRQRVTLILSIIVIGAALAFLEEALFRNWDISFVGNLNGGGLSSPFLQGLQYFVTIPTTLLLVVVLVIAIAIPLFMSHIGRSESDSMYIVILLFLYISASAAFNNYIWLFPWAVLSVRVWSYYPRTLPSLIILSSPVFVAIFVANLIFGTGYQQGIFYFGYYVFHYNYLFLDTSAAFNKLVTAYNALLLASMVLALAHLLSRANRPLLIGAMEPVATPPSTSANGTPTRRSLTGFRLPSRPRLFAATAIIAVLCVLSLMFNANGPTLVNTNSVNGPPTGLFRPSSPSGQFVMSVNGVTYSSDRNTVVIYPNSPPVGFVRNLSSQYATLNLTYLALNEFDGVAEILNSTPLGLSATPETSASLPSYNIMAPTQTIHAPSTNSSNPILNNAGPIYSFTGNSRLDYTIGTNFTGKYYIFCFRMTALPSEESILWYLGNANNTRGVDLIPFYGKAYLAYGNNILTLGYTNATLDGWNIAYFQPENSGLRVGLDGTSVFVNSSYFSQTQLFSPGAQLRIGYPNDGDQYNYTFYGSTTAIYRSTSAPSLLVNRSLTVRDGANLTQLPGLACRRFGFDKRLFSRFRA